MTVRKPFIRMNRHFYRLFFICALVFIACRAGADDAIKALRSEISAAPASAPAALNRLLRAAGSNAGALAAPATVAAIQSLGPEATGKQISAVVFAAVRAAPDNALAIIRAAVAAAPNAAPEIAGAAARAVPNPWKEVRYVKQSPTDQPTATPGPQSANQVAMNKEPDFKSTVDTAFQQAVESVLDPAAPGDPMTLAEAIVEAASDASGGQNLAAIQSAVDAALYGHTGALFAAVGGARGISGVGDAGNANYANEPFDPGQLTTNAGGGVGRALQSPVLRPNPPVVSP